LKAKINLRPWSKYACAWAFRVDTGWCSVPRPRSSAIGAEDVPGAVVCAEVPTGSTRDSSIKISGTGFIDITSRVKNSGSSAWIRRKHAL
jgi:hypothetical protein